MARIRITPEQVRQVSAQFAQAANQSQEMVSRLTNAVNSMQPEWEGMTSQRFYGDFQQWSSQMARFVELLNSISTQLNQIADRFAAADQQ
ncbi:MAG: WXG100 family type VII secretion target [Anaerolineae bacterium]|jgi:WXG100 family type VII secretion target